jgi:hypothetical protein
MSPRDVVQTKLIAKHRIHVERVINKIKNFKLVSRTIPIKIFHITNEIQTILDAAAFQEDSQWNLLEYYMNDIADIKVYDYIQIHTQHPGDYSTIVRCYTREEPYSDADPPHYNFPGSLDYCPLGEKCTVTVAQRDASSPTLYYAGCQPNNTDICANQGCRNNSPALYIGDGLYDSVCDWCCGYDQCNNIRNCTRESCVFYGPPRNDTKPIEDNGDTNTATIICSLSILPLLITIVSHLLTTILILV